MKPTGFLYFYYYFLKQKNSCFQLLSFCIFKTTYMWHSLRINYLACWFTLAVTSWLRHSVSFASQMSRPFHDQPFTSSLVPVCSFMSEPLSQLNWSSPRPISNSQLHTLLYFHLCPIYLVVFKGSYFFRMGYLILRGASRLDAFSVYPFQTWLLGHRLGSLTDTPAVCPSRSSRTKDSSSQISYAHAG